MKLFKKTIKKFFIFIIVFGLAFSNLPYNAAMTVLQSYIDNRNVVDKIWVASYDGNVVDKFVPFENVIRNLKIKDALAVSNGDAKIFYSISANTTPRTRDYISSTNSFNTAATTVAGATALQVVTKASPTKDEMIAGYVNSAGTLQVACWNGTSWTNEWSVASGGTGTTRRFDIAYETNSGDAMVLYSTNVGTTNELAYRTKPGASACGSANWSAATNLDPVRTSGIVHWVKLAHDRRAAQNLITAIWADANADLSAMVWSGTTWGNEPTAALETALEIVTAGQDVESFDVEYESLSGDVMIVRGSGGTNGTNGGYYSTCTGGTSACTWTTRTAMPTILDDTTHLDISANPNSDSILFGAIGNAGADLSRGVWSGSAWTNTANADTSSAGPLAGTKFVATGWLISGANTRGVLVYYDSAAVNIGWSTVSGTTWTTQSDWVPTPAFGVQKNYDIKMDPINKDRLIFTVNDANSDIFAKRLILSGTTFTWSNADGSAAIEANTGSAIYKSFNFEYNRYIPAPTNTLTIGVTAGSKVTAINSGDTSVYANTTGCTSAATCAAFTLNVSNTSVTVGSIKITETGSANATSDLSQLALFYDTDGNYSNGITGQYGATVASFTSEAATVSGSLALTPATTYYFYTRFNASSTISYPKGGQTVNFQIAANGDVTLSSGSATISGAPQSMAGTTTILPKVSSVSYGAGLSDGARSSEAITISGYGFGVAPGGSRANCAGAVDTGCVRFLVGGADTVADASISSWSNTSVGLTISSTLATLGGASSLELVSGAQGTATDTTYYIYPNITSLVATSTNAAREYAAGDVDGLVMLQGDHFGSAQGTVAFTGAFGGGSATIHATAEGSCATGGWSAGSYSGNSVCIEVTPASIPDSVYSGSITLTRNSDSKTHPFSTFSIMPRIISNTPANGIVADVIQVLGNHFCQSGTCPTSPNRSDTSNNVKFGSTQALDSDFANQTGGAGACNGAGAGWTHAEICVKVPSGIPTGSQPTKVRTNNTYDSNTKTFTVNSTVPNDPTNLNQFKENGTTMIPAGGTTVSSNVVLKATSTASLSINMLLQVEVEATGASFDGIGIIDGPVCTGCTSTSTAVNVAGLSDGTKHWRARTKNTSTSEYSNWVYYGTSDINETDFKIDSTAPTITFTPTDTCAGGQSNLGSNSVTINWSLNEQANGQAEYSTNSDLSGSINYPIPASATSTSHAIILSNLNSGTTYYYKAKSQDNAGNLANRPSAQPYCSFTTGSVTQPAKTTKFFVIGATSTIAGGSTASTSFAVYMPETAASTTSAFAVIRGIYDTTGSSPNKIGIQINSQAVKYYEIPLILGKGHFKFIYQIITLNVDPTTNTLYITPEANTSVNVSSVDVSVTYKYSP
ncbi:MAG: hypothetical protein AAB596_02055 [Patescibacteria group bacterium]